ncbi:MAG: hypothetical protein ACLQJR_10665 [Stellaceae bacterium]
MSGEAADRARRRMSARGLRVDAFGLCTIDPSIGSERSFFAQLDAARCRLPVILKRCARTLVDCLESLLTRSMNVPQDCAT